ncbi:uncharacterized protein LOC130179110 [Seriola aureovittata]|uniref:uncharacterized protein LOC130179110 n=1 Tax=Seriola aureovittata TaxID=2871759 RepID=UPI0024BEE995|nr:uncharacterized protein LOC130179110 [Seriola aureovittata]
MHRLGILVLMLFHLSQAFPVPLDTVLVQVQQWVVVGAQRIEEQVLLNGVSLTGTSQEFNSIIKTISTDGLPLTLISVNQSSVLRNHTIRRSRECILEGSKLHWADRVFYDGKPYLTLDHNDTWTTQVPQAFAFKVLWDQEVQYARTGRLQEECIKLMRELKLSEEQPVPRIPLPQILIPILAVLAFTGLIIISLLLSKNQGLRHPGGVLGSIIHYPKEMTEVGSEIKGDGYSTL